MDCGKVQTERGGGRFMVSAGIGYDAAVCWGVNHSGLKKILNRMRLGKLTYLILELMSYLLLKDSAVSWNWTAGVKFFFGTFCFVL